ncbi:piezo-type mechanosensitive ion channel component-like [Ixodes scapularis]
MLAADARPCKILQDQARPCKTLQDLARPCKTRAEYKSSALAQGFLTSHDVSDVSLITLNGNSTAVWTVSPPSRNALVDELRSSAVTLRLKWSFTRDVDDETNAEKLVENEHSVQLTDEAVRMRLSNMLTGSAENVTVPPILPRYLLVPRKGKVEVVRALDIPGLDTYRRLTLRLRNGAFRNLSSESDWWEVTERCTDTYPFPFLREDKQACTHLNLVIFNEKAFPQALSQITKYG